MKFRCLVLVGVAMIGLCSGIHAQDRTVAGFAGASYDSYSDTDSEFGFGLALRLYPDDRLVLLFGANATADSLVTDPVPARIGSVTVSERLVTSGGGEGGDPLEIESVEEARLGISTQKIPLQFDLLQLSAGAAFFVVHTEPFRVGAGATLDYLAANSASGTELTASDAENLDFDVDGNFGATALLLVEWNPHTDMIVFFDAGYAYGEIDYKIKDARLGAVGRGPSTGTIDLGGFRARFGLGFYL